MVATGLGEREHEIPWLDDCCLWLIFLCESTVEESHERSSLGIQVVIIHEKYYSVRVFSWK